MGFIQRISENVSSIVVVKIEYKLAIEDNINNYDNV